MASLHPDFDQPWCKELLADPNIKWAKQSQDEWPKGKVTNSLFEVTLYNDRALRAHLSFYRPCKEPDAVKDWEECFLLSIGDGLDGKTGRAHGGFNSLVLDQLAGSCAHHAAPNPIPPATATITIDFKAPIDTPCVVLCRGWATKIERRKIFVRAIIENGTGKLLASSNSLFISARSAL